MTDATDGAVEAHRAAPSRPWHALPAAVVLDELDSSPQGLGATDAAGRRNMAAAPDKPREEGFVEEFFESFTEPLQLLLIAIAGLSAVFGELRDAAAIGVIVVLVAVVETVTETRSAKAIAALDALSAPTARVLREGDVVEVPSAELVAGDVVVLEAGDLVPADLRVLEVSGLRVDESAFTGEPAPVGKAPAPVHAEAALAERTSLLLGGTSTVAGSGRAVVVATGPDTELGRLGRLVATADKGPTGLQKSLGEVARAVLVLAVVVSVAVPLVGVAAGRPVREMLLTGLSLAFATVPEELPILITVLLAVAGRQLAGKGALLRRLGSAETLGTVSVVVTDKTGTLTRNELELADLLPAAGSTSRDVLRAGVLSHAPSGPNAREPLEVSLDRAAAAQGVRPDGQEVDSHPFDAASKLVTRVWERPDGTRQVVTAGAPESVLDRCDLPADEREGWLATIEQRSAAGLRLVAFGAHETGPGQQSRAELERGLRLVGMAVFEDPLRPGVGPAVAELATAGIATILVTGDHPSTARAVAGQAGLASGPLLHGGAALDRVPDEELLRQLRDGTVLARATPADKLRVVRLLRSRGEVVAVTGDGVNDAPALAAADVGIAMGLRGSDLARQAAGLVLVDDAFPTVSAAVAAGRNVSSQLRRAVAFYLGAKLALVLAMFVPLLLGRPAPFTPATIALLELFMDLGASVAFVAEPAAAKIMRRPPPPPTARFLGRRQLLGIAAAGAGLAVAVVPAYLLVDLPTDGARAAALAAWLCGHALIAWTLRVDAALPLRQNPAFPAWALAAVLVAVLVTATPAAAALGLTGLTAAAAAVVAASVLAGAALSAVLRRALQLDQL